MGKLIKDKFEAWVQECNNRFNTVKENEEELNRIFINIYGLQDELKPEESDDEVTIRKAVLDREIKSLISYSIGCIFGRYSLEKEGLIFAGGVFDKSKYGNYVDSDGILPIYKLPNINGDLYLQIESLIKHIYGDDTFGENLNFIADALGKKPGETSEDTLRRYITNDFYPNHLQIYQKRPIYWMFSSGKLGAFKCLIYMHRYNPDTLATINLKYFFKAQALYKTERERLENQIRSDVLDSGDKRKAEKELENIIAYQKELDEYGQALGHMADKRISIDLDDGVKVNYQKFQNVEMDTDSGKIKKDLLVPIKEFEKKSK